MQRKKFAYYKEKSGDEIVINIKDKMNEKRYYINPQP